MSEREDDIIERLDTIASLLDKLVARPVPRDPDDPPLIDGCRIVNRGDGHSVCRVHNRYWRTGGVCPGRFAT